MVERHGAYPHRDFYKESCNFAECTKYWYLVVYLTLLHSERPHFDRSERNRVKVSVSTISISQGIVRRTRRIDSFFSSYIIIYMHLRCDFKSVEEIR